MGILSWLLFGLIAGAIAKAIHPGKDPGGWLVTIVIGILGSMVGGWLGSMLFNIDVTGFNLKSFFVAVGGALILLVLYSKVIAKK
ncbi:GlsB/YeaQ/YmgE family stress response membrane protein [Riemerella anatipestifer]|uniref:GlsB/YeaQ/YmgE family stress response membrane protein n=3 Tax=Riemerella anatipestifer TaxID=34085 RepID=A0A161PU32_RIEAN|nr:GlsB/YeaQ/YmgE family stress response membrane protein [Riemerella anatipestifer]ADQ82375.1 Transglycosylase-associated protein [Riemerella anatipestifer ATCC 11845 = DSM 15868]ADZ12131.1 Predicted membrane protein [Riemerella anatipestifer RA-GD]AFD56377.1 transglycosylase-associated protein [Riemerella anatipestifer ATCC 11845 = DSM 15868]AFR35267.1 putative membrane protein [Riemerella anatipestifer RA-CH-1]AGC39696.1 putative membrane protein [Riemerella anatipestifer RA-CH-2]